MKKITPDFCLQLSTMKWLMIISFNKILRNSSKRKRRREFFYPIIHDLADLKNITVKAKKLSQR